MHVGRHLRQEARKLDHVRIGLLIAALAGALAAFSASAQQPFALPASIPGLLLISPTWYRGLRWVAISTLPLLLKFGARAQPSGDATELAKALSNPVADLVSAPFQFNWEQGVGYQDATRGDERSAGRAIHVE